MFVIHHSSRLIPLVSSENRWFISLSVLAIELVASAQGIDLLRLLQSDAGIERLQAMLSHRAIRISRPI